MTENAQGDEQAEPDRGELQIGDTLVEVLGFQGSEGRLFVLRDRAKRPKGRVNDAYYPPADLGHIWIREVGTRWVASGKVNADLIDNQSTDHQSFDIDRILDFISDTMLGLGHELATCIELVSAQTTHVSSGEEDLVW